MTKTLILDESAVSEIEARLHLTTDGDAVFVLSNVRALCATVKHLRAEVDRSALCEECDQWEYNEDGSVRTFMVCGACWNAQQVKLEQLRAENEQANTQIADLERRLKIPFGKFPCGLCGGPHDFDTSVPSVVWNQVIRAKGLPDYLCTTCIVRTFVKERRGFTAELWSEEFNGVPIEVVVNGQNAKDASLVQEENNSLRHRLSETEKELSGSAEAIVNEAGKVGQLMNLASASAVDDFRTRAVQLCKQKALKYKALADDSLPNDQTAARTAAMATALNAIAVELEKL